MKSLQLPENYQHVMPYLIIANADKFIPFMQQVFDAKEKMKHLREDGTIMHGEVMIGDSTIMFANGDAGWGIQPAGMYVNVPDADTCYDRALAAGATSIMTVEDKPYGRSGGVKDPFGNTWWITTP